MIPFPIVDTHVHLWDTKRLRYPWLAGVPALNRPFTIEDFKKACGAVPVGKIVFVQCDCDPAQRFQEVEFVMESAKADSRLEGIVAFAPLENGARVEPDLAKLADNRLVKGVRRILQGEQDLEFCLRPDFVRGVQLLHKFNLTFDLCINQRQLAGVTKLVEKCPDVFFILDHIGKPDIAKRVMQPWKDEIKALATLPNCWCKISGLVTEADREHWKRDDLKPYIAHVIACFGFDRVLYGSDWPVATLASEYPRWVEVLEWAVAGCSANELKKLFGGNAEQFYRLGHTK